MSRHLPPLPALRAFEAAARHLSFARAGGELGVTPGAISHQMKQLEDWVGDPLFERRANGVRLTETGRVFATRLGAIFDQITSAAVAARAPGGTSSVTVRCQFSRLEMAGAAHWKVSRTASRYPDRRAGPATPLECQ